MHWERLSEDVYVFTSDRYAQVTASLIVSGRVGVMIDTLPFPEETGQIALFARRRCPDGVRYVIYTQHQADHTYGAFLFPKAEIVAHALCRDILLDKGTRALEAARARSAELAMVRLRLPTLTFHSGVFALRLPGKTLEIFPTPGHTVDSVSVILQEEKILFAGDTVMAIPTVGDGDIGQLRQSIDMIAAMPLESIVQGHGEIILRGEIKDNVRRSLNYLEHLEDKVRKLVEAGGSREDARRITLESCGLQRVLLSGVVGQLHLANVLTLYDRLAPPPPKPAPPAPQIEAPAARAVGARAMPDSSKPALKTAPKSAPKPGSKAASKSATKSASKPGSKPAPKTASKPAAESAARSDAARKSTARSPRSTARKKPAAARKKDQSGA
jgi:glyoxylase-like metal-dependent hydrolase (beta-lactamase superfamily II)